MTDRARTARPPGIRIRLAWFALAVSLPIVTLLILGVVRNNRASRLDAERRLAALAERVAGRLSQRLDDFEHLLAGATRVVEPRPEAAARNTALLAAIASRLSLSRGATLIATDRTGRLVGWSRLDAPVPDVTLADRPHFVATMSGARRVIGSPVRLRNDTTVWGLTIAEPIPGPDGRPAGMLGVTLRLSMLGPELDLPDLPAGAVVQLQDSTTIIARSADAAIWVGRRAPRTNVVGGSTDSPEAAPVRWGDDVLRYTARRPVPNAPDWHVDIGLPVALVDAPLERDLQTAWIFGLLALSVAYALGRWMSGRIVTPLRALASDAERLARGGPATRPAPPPAGAVAEVTTLATALDTMALREAERTAALRQAETNARVLFEQSPVPMLVITGDTLLIADVNAAAATLLGWEGKSLVGRTVESLRPAEDLPRWRAMVASLGDGVTHLGQWRYLTRDERTLDVELVTARTLLDGKTAYLTVVTDVTERLAAERALADGQEELRQAQKMEALGRFAGGIAHDFNNLLTAILGQIEVTLDDLEADSPVRQDLEPVRRSAERMAGLTKQILAFGRRQVVKPVTLDLRTVIQEFEPTMSRLLPSGVDLAITCGDAPAWLVADRAQVEQVLLNLAVNARDAMPQGGTIAISVDRDAIGPTEALQAGRRDGPAVRLSVRDTGLGIEPSLQPRIFEPFFTTKAPGKGTGLGLATVYAIMQQAGGVIRVDSAPGQGTRFDVLWPAAPEAEDDGRQTSGPRPALSAVPPRETVLIVDDEEGIRRLVSTALARLGYRVLSAADGVEAAEVAAAHRGPIHLVVTDCVMPRMGGRELAAALRELRPATRVLFVSGHTDDTTLLAAIAAEQAAFLPKPFTPGTLTARVRELLDA